MKTQKSNTQIAKEKSTASKKNEEATVAADASPTQPSPKIVKTSEISSGKEHPRESDEGNPMSIQTAPIVEIVKTSQLKLNPQNERIYGPPKTNKALMDSIRDVGIRQPLIVNSDGTVLQGNSRFSVARDLKLPTIPIIRVHLPDKVDQLEMLLAGNAQREKTHEERAREYKGYLEVESARAKRRQATNQGNGTNADSENQESAHSPGSKKGKKAQVRKNSSEGEAEFGKARDIAAERVSWCGPTAQNALKVVAAIDVLAKEDANSAILETVREKFATSVNAAFQECVRQNLFDKTGSNKSSAAHSEGFSRSNYSFASRKFDPFGADFKLNKKAMALLQTRKPADSADDADRSSILSLSVDLLHSNYSDEAINAFADDLESASHWNCLVETQEYQRSGSFKWPVNAWVGFTVSTQKEIDQAEEVIQSVRAETRWIHIRLDSESLTFRKLGEFDWIVISVINENLDWVDVEPILMAARKAKCRVFFDQSVKCRPQEYPRAKKGN